MINNLKILGIIPARAGSKGIPKKNIKILGDKPLILHTLAAASKSKHLDRIHVSTDSEEIKAIVEKSGFKVPFLRDPEYARDDVPNIPDVINHVIDTIKEKEKYTADIVVFLEPTYPFRSSETIDMTIEAAATSGADWAVTISKVKEHPLRMRKYNSDSKKIESFLQDKDVFVQRQEFDNLYSIKGAVYATKTKNLKKDLRLCSWHGVVIDHMEAIDIDEIFDFRVANALAITNCEGRL